MLMVHQSKISLICQLYATTNDHSTHTSGVVAPGGTPSIRVRKKGKKGKKEGDWKIAARLGRAMGWAADFSPP